MIERAIAEIFDRSFDSELVRTSGGRHRLGQLDLVVAVAEYAALSVRALQRPIHQVAVDVPFLACRQAGAVPEVEAQLAVELQIRSGRQIDGVALGAVLWTEQ